MAREPGIPDSRFPLRRDGADDDGVQPQGWRPQGRRDKREPIWRPGIGAGESTAPHEPYRGRYGGAGGGFDGGDDLPPAVPAKRGIRWGRWIVRGLAVCILLFIAAVAWLAITAPLSKSLRPPAPPSITLLASDGTPIARRGAVIGKPVDVSKLPDHVAQAFIAIEDRRFYNHWGVDPRGIARAAFHNVSSGGGSQGGSTITQQLAKNAFLNSRRTFGRKAQEVLIAFWLEAWLSKDEILSRYLSNVYFGDNVYGLRAAAQHYFSTSPEHLTLSQATLLAGLVKAPSRLAPTGNLDGARERQRLVIGAMQEAGFITAAEARRVRPAMLHVQDSDERLPNGTYFADWVLPEARDRAGGVATEQTVTTTLDTRLQNAAERVIKASGLGKAQVALVAMRPDGRVVAMVGGRNYAASPFNRATQARRQPGSAFKLFVYLAALRSGMTPDTMVDDTPVQIGDWKPSNSDGRYAGRITLRQAMAKSSNVVAARLIQKLGVGRVTQAARDLGISTPLGNDASIALGTSTGSLLELTAAYAAVANGSYPVRPRGLDEEESADDWLARRLGGPSRFDERLLEDLRSMLETVVQSGTGRSAALPVPAFGKTGTTQDGRDALFVGWAGDLVVGVWIGNDDNSPVSGASGGGLPAHIWRDFMVRALGLTLPPVPVEPDNVIDENGIVLDDVLNSAGVQVDEEGVQLDLGRVRELVPEGEVRDAIPRNLRIPAPGSDADRRRRDPPREDPEGEE
ncbi:MULTISPECIES: transglycosylase domain-containing protein [Sphingomonas]|uniref:Penicillin-binding protein 1A n=1 Tax=Sphingomonas trueperi TaxID=53317 RepID=A0A7X5XZM8_9SPHN|nr:MULTISPECIES: transglycosylase domain-containing protein [Sphingomonas]NJB98347.1 penicillin-binding protein 1A [Sphingomonas trueperi]